MWCKLLPGAICSGWRIAARGASLFVLRPRGHRSAQFANCSVILGLGKHMKAQLLAGGERLPAAGRGGSAALGTRARRGGGSSRLRLRGPPVGVCAAETEAGGHPVG
jgi:hypothetical protein